MQLETERQKSREALQELDEVRRKGLDSSVEVERMRTVFTQLDSMREELVAKLKAKFAEVCNPWRDGKRQHGSEKGEISCKAKQRAEAGEEFCWRMGRRAVVLADA